MKREENNKRIDWNANRKHLLGSEQGMKKEEKRYTNTKPQSQAGCSEDREAFLSALFWT